MKWKLVPVEPTQEIIKAIADERTIGSFIGMTRREYLAALKAAPKPPALSDERILEVARSQSCPDTGGFWFEGKSELIDMVRAIEREILGEKA